jgi:deazaflavin-dependent oxidoreductase (nitroreductase family)
MEFCSLGPIAATLYVRMKPNEPHFIAPNLFARAVNRFYGWLTSVGLGPSYGFLLQIKGRKTGMTYSTPVNLLVYEKKLYLVGTRGHTQWSRNALVAKKATLKKGRVLMQFRLRALTDEEKPVILKAYLTRFNWMVRRFFPIPSDSPLSTFSAIASQYPVFELSRE